VPAAQPPGFFGRIEEHFRPGAERAGAEAGQLAAEGRSALLAHQSTAFHVAGDILDLLRGVDSPDDPLYAKVAALVPKAYALAGSALDLAIKL
jgi:hypothetical protein